MPLAPVALADLGVNRDAAITAAALVGKTVSMSPQLLVVCGRVSGAVADLRLHRRDSELGRWVPSAVALTTVNPATDGGLFELRFNTAEIPGDYAIVQEGGLGVVEYVFRPGRN